MSNLLEKVANLLELVSDEISLKETTTETTQTKTAEENPLVIKLREATGEDISPELIEKISADSSLTELFDKLPIFRAPGSLGGPSEKSAAKSPDSKEEKISAAYDRFGDALARFGS